MTTNELLKQPQIIASCFIVSEGVPVPVTEGGEAHGGGDECHGPGEGGATAEKEGEQAAHAVWEKLTRNGNTHTRVNPQPGSTQIHIRPHAASHTPHLH